MNFSPYISRGVISTRQVLERWLAKGYKIAEIESLVKELCCGGGNEKSPSK